LTRVNDGRTGSAAIYPNERRGRREGVAGGHALRFADRSAAAVTARGRSSRFLAGPFPRQ